MKNQARECPPIMSPIISHHGAISGVTGSCHRITLADGRAILIDCGLFQGDDVGSDGAHSDALHIQFDITSVIAIVITHVHIDHVGRLPYLLAAGFRGPIFCSQASATLLPMVLADALKVGFTRDATLIDAVLAFLKTRVVPLAYGEWSALDSRKSNAEQPAIRLQPAGHILGSAYVEVRADNSYVVFSGDLGAPNTPLLPEPKSPGRADVVVLESTYGDRVHESRHTRMQRLKAIVEHAVLDGGTIIIPAFSIGRTQELLYEFEELFRMHSRSPSGSWSGLQVVLDSPLAANFTRGYQSLRDHWDEEAKSKVAAGRHPLAFEQLVTVNSHTDHQRMVNYLSHSKQPAIVIAASGMCAGGRVMNYLKAMLPESRHDVLFVGYQAHGTPGRVIQRYGPRGGYVDIDGERYDIKAQIHTIGGYSAHADQQDLLRFVTGIPQAPKEIRLVHGDATAKATLRDLLAAALPQTAVVISE